MMLHPAESQYSYTFDGVLLILEDLNGDKSLTNDMQNVLVKIANIEGLTLQELAEKKIMYRDSMGQWDGVRPIIKKESFGGIETDMLVNIEFFSLGGQTDFETAMYKRLAQP